MATRKDILDRLRDSEDGFTERKPDSMSTSDLRTSLVAFANSVPHGREAILYIGVSDNGEPLGVTNPDAKQKAVRKAAVDCYPPVLFQSEVLEVDGKNIVAVVVPESVARPHFSGGCYVRRGSETVQASEVEYDRLILSRIDKCRFMRQHAAAQWTVRSYGRHIDEPQPLESNMSSGAVCRFVDCNAFYAQFSRLDSSQQFSVEMNAVSLLWDDKNNRPMAVIRPMLYARGA